MKTALQLNGNRNARLAQSVLEFDAPLVCLTAS
jgi:hypothetical protein